MIRSGLIVALSLTLVHGQLAARQNVTRYVRFAAGDRQAYGVLEDRTIHELSGAPYSGGTRTGRTHTLDAVRLLAPAEPRNVIAVGLNYRSHLGQRPVPTYPGLFAKFPTSIVGPGADIVLPPDAKNAHYEGELVLVIGRTAKNVPAERAMQHVFGVTAGNDVSERDWQQSDLQWLRAKASDTFGPIGPMIVSGLNYDDLLVQTRVNGEVRQTERTKDLIFGISEIVSYISRYVTLQPGDIIFTGTPQSTRAIKDGDVVEIEVEGVGVLRNKVTQQK
jgi:2-keto-4-pentenoate hydratase/2-oxohepta-3-ene-1,7-dioic acid hydratase in catechol pathway